MKLVSLVGLVMAAVAGLGSSSTHAWTITSTNAMQASEFVGKDQELVKVWTVRGSSPVHAMQFAAAGSVFIDYGPNTLTSASTTADRRAASLTGAVDALVDGEKAVAEIFLRGNSAALLDEIEVAEYAGAITVRLKNKNFHGSGYLLTQVVVSEKAALAKISTSGSSSVYLSEGVVVSDSSTRAEISISGSADVFVAAEATTLSLKSLDLKVSGSGTIQFHTASLSLSDTLLSTISGAGTIAVVSASMDVGNTIETRISGSGDVYVQADKVKATHVDSTISGHGAITLSTSGTCGSQAISISGSGNVAAGSILCKDTTLKLSGIGSVLVQTSGTFMVPHEIYGKVQYWGTAPHQITDGRKPRTPCRPRTHRPHSSHKSTHNGWFGGWWDDDSDDSDEFDGCVRDGDSQHHLPNSVTAASDNKFHAYAVRELPARVATAITLTIGQSRHGSESNASPTFRFTDWDMDSSDSADVDGWGGWNLAATRIHEQHGPAGTAVLGVFAVAAVATVGVAVHKVVMQRRRRREYQPLLQVVAN